MYVQLYTSHGAEMTIPMKKKKTNYLNNKDLLAEHAQSVIDDQMTPKLAHMLQLLCARYGKRGQFASYTYNDDMQAYAMLMLVKTWRSFNCLKSTNAFAFFTQCIKNSFIQFLNQEKRQRNIRDELLVKSGMNPSYNYQERKTTPKAGAEEGKTKTERTESIGQGLLDF